MTIRKDHNCIHCSIDCRADYNPECYECGKQITCSSKKGKVVNCYIWKPGKQCEYVTDWVCLDQCCAIPSIQIQSITGSIKNASQGINDWPEWKRNLSGIESDYTIHKPIRKQKRIK